MKKTFITGSDSNLFPSILMLINSMAQHMPKAILKICDYGFTPEQADFLSRLDLLLETPPHLKNSPHPWYNKAAMVDYLDDVEDECFIWLDADMVILRPFEEDINAIIEGMHDAGKSIAVCPDSFKAPIDGFIADWKTRNNTLDTFERQLADYNVSGDHIYLNSGFIICTDFEFARSWRDLVAKQDIWLLFEQNSFNTLAYHHQDKLQILETAVWNCHGKLLEDVLTPQGEENPVIIHVTSDGSQHFSGDVTMGLRGKNMSMKLKAFIRDDLRNIQMKHFEGTLTKHFDLLCETGVLR